MNHLETAKLFVSDAKKMWDKEDARYDFTEKLAKTHALIAIAEQLEDANRFKAMELEASGLIKKKENK